MLRAAAPRLSWHHVHAAHGILHRRLRSSVLGRVVGLIHPASPIDHLQGIIAWLDGDDDAPATGVFVRPRLR